MTRLLETLTRFELHPFSVHRECLCKYLGFCSFAKSGSRVVTAPSTAVDLKTEPEDRA
jgi:hypothetical protein